MKSFKKILLCADMIAAVTTACAMEESGQVGLLDEQQAQLSQNEWAKELIEGLDKHKHQIDSKDLNLLKGDISNNDPNAVESRMKEIRTKLGGLGCQLYDVNPLPKFDKILEMITVKAYINDNKLLWGLLGRVLGSTPLLCALRQKMLNEATMMINNGAFINDADNYKKTPLHYALKIKDYELIHLLIARGADVNSADYKGTTPLHSAVDHNHVDKRTLQLLIDRGADINKPDKKGRTPLLIARNRFGNNPDFSEI